ncbi:hypothetical protein EKO04_001684 [Ascochyta lentis]|uniref:PLL-like beta propeller domain-containing protein n=1 Tax=Ascochyta lentis TaxID=205686 RepID=A0A8H7JAT7_9PLEO|nr:hypothetical protein EKO04_001684 [Ascochyta lentis]
MAGEKSTADVEPVVAQEATGRKWWRRKRVWLLILVLGILVLFGVVFGAVYGVKRAQTSESERSDRDRLFAAQGGTSVLSSSQASRVETSTSTSASGRVSTSGPAPTPTDSSSNIESSSTESSSSASTPSPSSSPGVMLYPQGSVPRDISAAVAAPALLLWDLRSEGKLWKLEYGSTWGAYNDRQFLVAPVTVRTSSSTQTAVSVDGTRGRIVFMHFRDGKWGDWEELDFAAQFLTRPTVVSRAEGKVDVVSIDSNGYIWVVSYDGNVWSEWTELGAEFTGEVAVTSWGEDRLDIFCKSRALVLHKHWTADSGWAPEWESLGDPFSTDSIIEGLIPSSPLAASWRDGEDGVIDVVANGGGTVHNLFKNGAWSGWTTVYASHEGYEFPDTQSMIRGDGVDGRPFAHLISRGTDNCIHYNAFNGTNWDFWNMLWCNRDDDQSSHSDYPTQFLPTFMIDSGEGNIEMMMRNLKGNFLRLGVHGSAGDEWSNDNWENLGNPGT